MQLPARLTPIRCLGGPLNDVAVPFEGQVRIVRLIWRRPVNEAEAVTTEERPTPPPVATRRQAAHYRLILEPAGSLAYIHEGTDEG